MWAQLRMNTRLHYEVPRALAFSLPVLLGLGLSRFALAEAGLDAARAEPSSPSAGTEVHELPRTAVHDRGELRSHAEHAVPAESAPREDDQRHTDAGSREAVPDEDDLRIIDAHADRVVFMPTAETHPEGTLYVSSYEIIIPQVGYAVSDRTQITLTSTPPLGDDLGVLSDLTLKTVLVRSGRLRVAATASVTGLVGFEGEAFVLGRAGGIVQGCFDRACHSSASVGTTVLLAGPATLTANAAGIIWRATGALSVLGEVHSLLPLGRETGEFGGVGVATGFRLGWSRFAMDLTAEILPESTFEGTSVPLVIPFLALTYRFMPSRHLTATH
jgi:hypothetical protein